MKFKEFLLEAEAGEIKPTQLNKIKEYLIHNLLITPGAGRERIIVDARRAFKKFKIESPGDFVALRFLETSKEAKKWYLEALKECYEIKGNTVTEVVDFGASAFKLSNYDKLGEPPFKIEADQIEIKDCRNLSTIPLWLPNECTELTIGNNSISSFTGIQKTIKCRDFVIGNNKIASLAGIQKVISSCEFINFGTMPPPRGILSLFEISNLKGVFFDGFSTPIKEFKAEKFNNEYEEEVLSGILNKHLEGGRDIFECQDELVEAGLGELTLP